MITRINNIKKMIETSKRTLNECDRIILKNRELIEGYNKIFKNV